MNNWNQQFTALLRKSRPGFWGNWGLSSHIKVGAVGIVDPQSGEFRPVRDQLPGAELTEIEVTSDWILSSENVIRTESKSKGNASGTDPKTGITIQAETEIQWKFQASGAIASEFSLLKEVHLKDLTSVPKQFAWLAAQAEHVSFGSKGQVAQGFGVITSAIYAQSGLNLGSQEKNASFSLNGTAKGLSALLKEASPSANISGSYISTQQEKSINKHLWPASANSLPSSAIPIAYTFASFEGGLMIPNWIKKLGAFELVINSKLGTTYIVEIELSYDTPKGPVSTHSYVSGGLSKVIGNIPLNATNLVLDAKFIGFSNGNFTRKWAIPLGQWATGQRHIELTGVFPGKTSLRVLEEDLL